MGAFKGRTAVQGELLAATYVGKWLKVSGNLNDVHVYKLGGVPFIRITHVTLAGSPAVLMSFGRKWSDRLSVLSEGELITVLGQIDKVSRSDVWLKNCELLDVPAVNETECAMEPRNLNKASISSISQSRSVTPA